MLFSTSSDTRVNAKRLTLKEPTGRPGPRAGLGSVGAEGRRYSSSRDGCEDNLPAKGLNVKLLQLSSIPLNGFLMWNNLEIREHGALPNATVQ